MVYMNWWYKTIVSDVIMSHIIDCCTVNVIVGFCAEYEFFTMSILKALCMHKSMLWFIIKSVS